MLYADEKEVAIRAAVAAARLCEQVRWQRGGEALQKPDQSPVTVADFGAQAVICQALQRTFPQDSVVGEEDATLLQTPAMAPSLIQVQDAVQGILPGVSQDQVIEWINHGNGLPQKRFWSLDPIDGTKGFVRGDQYAIALALIEDGEVKLGVMACPALPVRGQDSPSESGVLFSAVRGQGATMMSLVSGETQTIRVNATPSNDSYRLIESVETDHGNPSLQRTIAQDIGITAPIIAMDSQAKYGAVARGDADLYLRLLAPDSHGYRENIWDHAPGIILLEEAGGQVTDMAGKPIDFSQGSKLSQNQGVIASNGLLHDKVLEALGTRKTQLSGV